MSTYLSHRLTIMDTLTLVVELVKAMAWPATTIVVAIMFRTELRALLSRLKKGKLGSAEFEFAEAVKELEQDLAEISPVPRPVAIETQLLDLATSNPRAALLTAWIDIETVLNRLAQKHGILADQASRNPSALIRALAKAELFPRTHIPVFMTIRQLRNQAVHDIDFNPPSDAVVGYIEIAEELKQLLIDATNKR